tara:strand:+ start:432 stop:875 length:444 start_codon:yes stop_codon:yes gene_type:complete
MAFIGSFAAAQSARAIGKYNADVYQQRAKYAEAKANVNREVFNKVDRPRLLKKQDADYDFLFVRALKSGAEVRPGTSPYLALLEARYNQATDLTIADYNAKQRYYEGINESLLLESKSIGEAFKGSMTARAETIKGLASAGSLLAGL